MAEGGSDGREYDRTDAEEAETRRENTVGDSCDGGEAETGRANNTEGKHEAETGSDGGGKGRFPFTRDFCGNKGRAATEKRTRQQRKDQRTNFQHLEKDKAQEMRAE